MNDLLTPVLTLILNYGYPIIVGVIFIGYLGIPISLNAVLLAAGAFSSDGTTLSIFVLIPLVTFSALLGDLFNYTLGKYFGGYLLHYITPKIGMNDGVMESVDAFMKRWGRWSIFFSRWLFTPIGIPVNLLAGISSYSKKKFIIFAALGEFLWASIYLLLGYWFGASWVSLWDYVSDTPQILLLFVAGVILIVFTLRVWRKK